MSIDQSGDGPSARVDHVLAFFNWNGTPRQPLWLFARMRQSTARKLLWNGPMGSFVAHEEGVMLSGEQLQKGYAAGAPLEIYVQAQDGSILDRRLVIISDRARLAAEAQKLKATVEAKGARFQTACEPDVMSPLPF